MVGAVDMAVTAIRPATAEAISLLMVVIPKNSETRGQGPSLLMAQRMRLTS